jgi:hypothetical protein
MASQKWLPRLQASEDPHERRRASLIAHWRALSGLGAQARTTGEQERGWEVPRPRGRQPEP